jgi:hypothetical protein
MKTLKILLILCLFLIISSCSKDKDQSASRKGNIILKVVHTVDDQVFKKDTLIYQNKAGNQYLVSNIQWFLSEIELFKRDGTVVKPFPDNGIFYIDSDLPSTCSIQLPEISVGDYVALKFTFGINETDNTNFRFVNPPESFMFWPEYLGGGYHYMKLNGKWMNQDRLLAPFNFHLGIGQIYNEKSIGSNNYFEFGQASSYAHCEGFNPPFSLPEVSSFVQNYFDVSHSLNFNVVPESDCKIKLEMQIEKWFDGIQPYNHNEWGGSIMQQQKAQDVARQNGTTVFRVSLNSI